MALSTASIYAPGASGPSSGLRVLVTRYWPRGVKKESVDLWLKGLGTAPDLIAQWKAGTVESEEFSRRYTEGLESEEAKSALEVLRSAIKGAGNERVTLFCTCKEGAECHRELLKELLES